MDKLDRDLESGLNDGNVTSVESGELSDTLLVAKELQERTSRLKTAWGYVKTAGKVLGVIGLTILAVGGTVMGVKSAVGSRGNSGNPGNSDNPGNAVDTVKPASLQAAGTARNLAQNQCDVPGEHFLASSIGQCWQDANEQKFEDIDANIDDLTSKLETVSEQVSKIDTLTADVSGIKTRLATAEASIAVHGTDIDGLKLKDTELTEKIAELVSKDGALQTAIESLATKNGELETLIESLEEKNTALEAKDTELEDLITDLQSDSTEIKETIEALKAKDTELKAEIDALSNTASQTQESLAALEKEFDTAKASLEGDISDLETRVAANENAIAALQVKDNELSEAIASVEEKLDLAKTELEGKITELDTAVDTRIAEAKKALEDKIAKVDEKIDTKIAKVDEKIDTNQADLLEKVENLMQENQELRRLFAVLNSKIEALENAGTSEKVAERLSTFGNALNSVASAIVGENVTVVDEVPLTESGKTKSAFALLKESREGTVKKASTSPEGIERVSSKIGGMDSRTKWAIGGVVAGSTVSVLLVVNIVLNIIIRKRVGAGKVGPITKALQDFFGEKHVHFNREKIDRDTKKYMDIAVERFAVEMGLYDPETRTMTKEQEEKFKVYLNQAMEILLHVARSSKDSDIDYEKAVAELMRVIKGKEKESESSVSSRSSHDSSDSGHNSDDGRSSDGGSSFGDDDYNDIHSAPHVRLRLANQVIPRSKSENDLDALRARIGVVTGDLDKSLDVTDSQSSAFSYSYLPTVFTSEYASNVGEDSSDVSIIEMEEIAGGSPRKTLSATAGSVRESSEGRRRCSSEGCSMGTLGGRTGRSSGSGSASCRLM